MAHVYGPYKVGEMVYTLTRTYGHGKDCGLLYGIVAKAGPKTWEVVWESGHRRRYRQNSLLIAHADADAFGYDADYQTKIEQRLRTTAGLTKG